MKKYLLQSIFFLLLVILGNYAYSQNSIVTGTVTAKEDGEPIPGATVKVKGTTIGTQTNIKGKYTLAVPANAILVVSFIGYENQQVTANKPVIDVSLGLSSKALTEVVVTGSGIATSKAKLGISVESVSGKSLATSPQASIDQGLIGKIPGAEISSVDGTPGAKANIVLRGINTVQGGTTPMYLVDGVQSAITDISQLDPASVDHIEVVQGAAASTIYGAQGANGVVQIFTKKGVVGKTRIEVSSSVSGGDLVNNGNVHQATLSSFAVNSAGQFINSSGQPIALNAYGEYPGIQWAYGSNSAAGFPTAMSNPLNVYHKQYGTNLKYYDHLAQLFTTAYTTNNNVTLSGGAAKSDYLFSLSNNYQESDIKNNGFNNRTNMTVNLGTELFKGFTFRSITQLIYTKNTLNPEFGIGNTGGIFDALNASPFYDFNHKNADGSYPLSLSSGTVSVNGSNPNYFHQWGYQTTNREDLLQNFIADYKINRFVDLNAKYGINYSHNEQNQTYLNQTGTIQNQDTGNYFNDPTYAFAPDGSGELVNYTNNNFFQNFNASAVIKTDFKKDFHLNVPITTSTLLGYDYRSGNSHDLDSYGLGLPTYPIYKYNQTKNQAIWNDYTAKFVTFGYVINQKIDFSDIAGVAGGFRSDYSSNFGAGSKPFTFPDVNGYVRISSLDFWKNSALGSALPEFKIRGGYGEAGIQPNIYQRYATINPQNIGTELTFNLPSSGLANPNLNVEVSKEFEIGTDLEIRGFQGNWVSDLTVSGTYWNRKTTDAIYSVSTALSTGGSSISTNAIGLASHGVQASLNIAVYKSRDFNWNMTTNFSNQTSTITSIVGPPIILASAAGNASLALVAGQKIGEIYGVKALTSLSETNQEGVPYILPADYSQYTIVNGRVVNIASKSIVFTNEASSFGDPNPKFNLAFIENFNYKSLTFGFQLDWVYGSHLYNQTKEWMYRDGISSDYDNPVDIGGTTAAYTAYYRSAYANEFGAVNGDRNGTKDYFYENASFARLRNAYVGYDFGKLLGSKVFRKAVLTVSARNLFTITKYTGFDPEVSSGTSNSAYDRGVDNSSNPNTKSITVGLNLGF
ncbi:SusC/RagA family TonB-linked outer membrane protein [Mucilaginibacter sp. X4EP1]|uniref:SusC/RagA family TonB-linked outer membrane protein n=1 Tax=Mucilaginibacter sp. X4EP1 TaxID=2723092 RepID=UPI00216A59E4|nr:SusC/RagA family TonB-linked outer membrane protein [Mucilaginibacter sp. X4EP1]MCS3812375.1 TonB-linked SusC/RagA family outer membrane protein [Mucilaginibacter sp. X4EP1]